MEPSSASFHEHASFNEQEVDWGGSETDSPTGNASADAADFAVADNFDGQALVPPTPSPDTALDPLGLQLLFVGNDMFPDFLQPSTCLQQLGVSGAMKRMQDMKNARKSRCAGEPPRCTNKMRVFELA